MTILQIIKDYIVDYARTHKRCQIYAGAAFVVGCVIGASA